MRFISKNIVDAARSAVRDGARPLVEWLEDIVDEFWFDRLNQKAIV